MSLGVWRSNAAILHLKSGVNCWKFLLNFLLSLKTYVSDTFINIKTFWRHVEKSFPTLTSMSYSTNHLVPFMWCFSKRIILYNVPFTSLLSSPYVKNDPSLLGVPHNSLFNLSPYVVNDLFLFYIAEEFLDWWLVFTDGSVLTNSAGYAVYIPTFTVFFRCLSL